MKVRSFLAALLMIPALAQADDSCTGAGALVLEDPAGDQGVTQSTAGATAPVPVDDFDFLSLHMGEPTPGKLVFTYKVASHGTLPPQAAYIVRFATDTPPADGEDYFVAMLLDPSGAASFVYGTDGFALGAPAGEPRQFTIAGTLDASSNFNADGTITLVLDTSAVPSIEAGHAVFNILPTVRLVTPADALPFFTNADNSTIMDDTIETGYYDVTGGECGGTKIFGMTVGGLPAATLLWLAGAALLRRRLRRG
jgi:hypothetical protein